MRARFAAILLTAGAALGASTAAAAQPGPLPSPSAPPVPGRVRLHLRGTLGSALSFEQARTFTEFAETGRVESQYEADPGPGFEVGLLWRFGRRWGVSAAAGVVRRDGAGTFSASLPHPFFFGAPREVDGRFEGSEEKETSLHLDLAFLGTAGRLEWAAFAGPSLIRVDADLLRAVEYRHAYPYDSVTVTGTPLASARGSGFGFNLGAGLDWRVARRVALGLQGRFSRAPVGLTPAAGEEVEVDAGGFHVSAGVRVDF